MDKKFDYSAYVKLLKAIRTKNTNLCFNDFPLKENIGRYFILRHDVDFSPEAALEMAKIERENGFKATYFLLFSSPYYNLFSEEYCSFPKELIKLGHEVGLHYDVNVLSRIDEGKKKELSVEKVRLLERLSGKKIRSIAMHNPSISGKDFFRKYPGLINGYDEKFTKEISYLSDSSGVWRDPKASLLWEGQIPEKIQLLIHPIFWDHEDADRAVRIDNFIGKKIGLLLNKSKRLKDLWEKNSSIYPKT